MKEQERSVLLIGEDPKLGNQQDMQILRAIFGRITRKPTVKSATELDCVKAMILLFVLLVMNVVIVIIAHDRSQNQNQKGLQNQAESQV